MPNEEIKSDVERLEGKMAKMMDDVLGRKDGLVKVAYADASTSNYTYRKYKSAFLTLGDMQIPDDFRKIFQWCRYFFKFDPIIGGAVRALATFPVTDIVYNDTQDSEEDDATDEPSESYKFYTNMFKEMGLYSHLIEVGYDYFLYGNCVIFAEPGIKTVKRRDQSGQIVEQKEVVWKSVERLDVTRLRIDRDPQTKEKVYYYDVPADLKRIIETKKPKEKYDKIPRVFKEAVAKKGLVKLRSEFIYHFSMPAESGDSGLWGTPPVLHGMKLLMYTNILRQAQEAIAYEHIVPRRIYFFQETTNFAPDLNFAQLADDFAFELRKQLSDPNYQVISPIPVQQIQHGGNGRALLLVPEIEQLQNTILASMSVPREFIFGGVSYSGSTTSLRILENNFITYRTLLDNYINEFLIKRLAKLRGEWEVPDDDDRLITVEFSELKMQDDIQQKQLMIQLNAQGKLPDAVLYEKVFGLDAKKMFDMLRNEQVQKIKDQMIVQYEAALAQQEFQTKMQEAGLQVPMQPDPTDPNGGGQPTDPNAATAQDGAQTDAAGAAGTTQGAAPQNAAAGQGAQPAGPQPTPGGMDNTKAVTLAQNMLNMTEAERANVISKLPATESRIVMQYYQQLRAREEEDNGIDMRPLPQKLPPRRQGGV